MPISFSPAGLRFRGDSPQPSQTQAQAPEASTPPSFPVRKFNKEPTPPQTPESDSFHTNFAVDDSSEDLKVIYKRANGQGVQRVGLDHPEFLNDATSYMPTRPTYVPVRGDVGFRRKPQIIGPELQRQNIPRMRSRDKLQTGAQGTQTEEHKPPLSGEQKPKTKVQRAKRRNVQKAKLNARQEGKSFSLPLMLRRNP